MLKQAEHLKLNDVKLTALLCTLVAETVCTADDQVHADAKNDSTLNEINTPAECSGATPAQCTAPAVVDKTNNCSDHQNNQHHSCSPDGAAMSPTGTDERKRKHEMEKEEDILQKKQRRREDYNIEPTVPAFYYNLHRHSLKGRCIPR